MSNKRNPNSIGIGAADLILIAVVVAFMFAIGVVVGREIPFTKDDLMRKYLAMPHQEQLDFLTANLTSQAQMQISIATPCEPQK